MTMIPQFEESGYLPAGVYLASVEEITQRFGQESELRRVQVESIRWLIDISRLVGVKRLILNGSFVTDVHEPNDVDCVLLLESDYPRDQVAAAELQQGLPFINALMVNQEAFDFYVRVYFATDRRGVFKGMIEVEL